MNIPCAVEKKFKELFHDEPLLVRAPGRVNLIGEHTDYNMGFVLPAAIDKAMYFAIAPRTDLTCNIFAFDLHTEYQFAVNDLQFTKKGWPNYLMGVVDQFVKAGYNVRGFNCVFGGDIPIGAGLSSSAALEAGLAYSLNTIFDLGIDKLSLVKMAQKAENEFVGVKCGIMDQYISVFGKQDHVLRIDCRSLEYEYYPFNHNITLVLFDTCVKHSLASSEYNKRRAECAEGVNTIRKKYPEVTHLRDVSSAMLNECKSQMNETIYLRCKFVVEEDERLLKACESLQRNDLKVFGQFMFQTHDGLSKEYNVSCKELDYLVDLVRNNPNVYGARMMGGGFGGCTINLIEPNAVERITKIVTTEYKHKFGVEPKTYVTTISEGTSITKVKEDAKV